MLSCKYGWFLGTKLAFAKYVETTKPNKPKYPKNVPISNKPNLASTTVAGQIM